MRELVERHKGVLSDIARERKVTRQAIKRQVEKLGLKPLADELRAAAGKPGPRTSIDGADEKQRILEALASTGNTAQAVKKAGMSRRHFFRRKEHFQIDDDAVQRERDRLAVG